MPNDCSSSDGIPHFAAIFQRSVCSELTRVNRRPLFAEVFCAPRRVMAHGTSTKKCDLLWGKGEMNPSPQKNQDYSGNMAAANPRPNAARLYF
ncbi:hypothetical protein [Burkholderia stagnalis]|uniref:hypothetical protein n=1 Tax=Burkholderia stagnalis TaxID=1503054 RepID=UPI0012D9CF22|nr:hypothetical protein [Burkholderia stagnalis]